MTVKSIHRYNGI